MDKRVKLKTGQNENITILASVIGQKWERELTNLKIGGGKQKCDFSGTKLIRQNIFLIDEKGGC